MLTAFIALVTADTTATLRETWFVLPNWKWLGLATSILISFLLLLIIRPILSSIFNRTQKRIPQNNFVYFVLAEPIAAPLSWALTSAMMLVALDLLELPSGLARALDILTHIVLAVACIRLAYLLVESTGHRLEVFVKKTESTLDDQLAPFATKTLKIFVIVIGILIMLQSFGFNVVSLLAGLGLGGLAIALAAQETVANLFGSITIILDRPFQVGDYIKVTDTEGTVEEVGFRSTRIRTFYQSLVSIPNAIMAKEKIDNMGVRPRRRVRHTIGITYDADRPKIENFISQIRAILKQNHNVYQEDIVVVFHSYGDFSLNVLVNCFVFAADAATELLIQQDILFDIMKAAKESEVEFAFPTQTLHVSSVPKSSLELHQ